MDEIRKHTKKRNNVGEKKQTMMSYFDTQTSKLNTITFLRWRDTFLKIEISGRESQFFRKK